MSQLISDFIIEPVIRQARRLSGREVAPTAQASSNAPTEFPEYVDPISGQSTADQEEEALRNLTERLRTFPSLRRLQSETDASSVEEHRERAETDPEVYRRERRRPQLLTRDRFVSVNASFPTSDAAGFRFMNDSTMSRTSSVTQTSGGTPGVDSMLPEDDGMTVMRQKILEIHKANISSDQKSRMIHHMMLEQYSISGGGIRAQSPSSLQSHERPFTPLSRDSLDVVGTESPETSTSLAVDELVVTVDDIKPTFWISPPPPVDATPEQSRKNSIDQDRQFGCEHYKRNVKLQCSACLKWYTCRFCHDRVEDHCLNRQATKNMLCMYCGTAQAAAGECKSCRYCAAYYYCNLCKLWDDDSTKSIYHCDSCGICRRGEGLGKDFFHCQKCSACISMSLLDNHKCIERSTDCDCPICGEYMFTSPKTVVFMRCGHSIHYSCWREHMKNSYKCPICSKSMVNMDLTFRQYDTDIQAQPMPARFKDTKAWIFCNDCTNKSLIPFHWVGLKCHECDSYNTIRLQIISAPADVDLGAAEVDGPVPSPAIVSNQAIPEIVPVPSEIASGSTHVDISSCEPSASTIGNCAGHRQVGGEAKNAMEDEDEDDLDFWGGTSPRERALLEERMRAERVKESDSEGMSDDDDDDDPGPVEDDDEEEDDKMAIFGHR